MASNSMTLSNISGHQVPKDSETRSEKNYKRWKSACLCVYKGVKIKIMYYTFCKSVFAKSLFYHPHKQKPFVPLIDIFDVLLINTRWFQNQLQNTHIQPTFWSCLDDVSKEITTRPKIFSIAINLITIPPPPPRSFERSAKAVRAMSFNLICRRREEPKLEIFCCRYVH